MKTLVSFILICAGWLWVGWLGGWVHAHHTVATECKKLERFYAGDEVFRCKQGSEE